jgi:hypothetical protein
VIARTSQIRRFYYEADCKVTASRNQEIERDGV